MVDSTSAIGTIQVEEGFGYFGHHYCVSSLDGIVAQAGGGQRANADLSRMFNRVITVANPGDSGTLPVAQKGKFVIVCSTSTTSMNIMPGIGDAINNLGANQAFAFTGSAAGKSVLFFSPVNGQWQSLVGA
jgi:hypothetical protein